MASEQSPLRVAAVWTSTRPQPPRDAFPVTVVTQLSVGRLGQLEALCRSWAGPLAAAVWIPLVLKGKNGSSGKSSNVTYSLGTIDDGGLQLTEAHRAAIAKEAAVINALHQRAEQAGPCQLDVMLVYELYASDKVAGLLYPVNVMRNLARLMARTPIMGAFDVDMMVGGKLAQQLASDGAAASDLLYRILGNTTRAREAAARAEKASEVGRTLAAIAAAEEAKVKAEAAKEAARVAEAAAAEAAAKAAALLSNPGASSAVAAALGTTSAAASASTGGAAAGSGAGAATGSAAAGAARRLLLIRGSGFKIKGTRRRRTKQDEDNGDEAVEGEDEDADESGAGGGDEDEEDQAKAEAAAEAEAAAAEAADASADLSAFGGVPATAAGNASRPVRPHPMDGRVAVVLPAFTTDWRLDQESNWALKLAEMLALGSVDKGDLRKWYKYKRLRRFAPQRTTHVLTNTPKWLKTHEWYNVSYRFMYEPWVLVDRLTSPWHDIRFRGYGMNKVMHLYHLNGLGYQLQVHPRAYLVHRPHRASSAKRKHSFDGGDKGLRGRANTLSAAVRSAVKKGTYEPWLDSMTEACRQVLPWWREGPWVEAPSTARKKS